MDELNKELKGTNESIERFVSVLKVILYEKKKEKDIYIIMDYLREQIYLRDLDLADDCYEIFFQEIYDLFSQKNLSHFYIKIMITYIDKCLIDNGDLNSFIEGLGHLLKMVVDYPTTLQENDIFELEKKLKIKKHNLSTLTLETM